jgi:DNA mismatch repair ATPase MutS
MFIDSATLQDLEIMPTPTVRGTTLWSLVNRTRTRVGSEALREQLLHPPHTADEILALQRAHQVLADDANAYRGTLDRAVVSRQVVEIDRTFREQ